LDLAAPHLSFLERVPTVGRGNQRKLDAAKQVVLGHSAVVNMVEDMEAYFG
jgi:hypothetical protein